MESVMLSSAVGVAQQQQQQAAMLPPGFRFHPTDEELILHYLRNRAASLPCPVPIIADVDIYKFDPWDLPCKAAYGDGEWYFFSPRDRKYPNGIRPNRAAGSGYWKATGTDRPVHDAATGESVGVKKALVFYRGRPPKGAKTSWIMHEYRLAAADPLVTFRPPLKFRNVSMRLDDWVLCRIYKKSGQASTSPSPVAPPLVDYDNLTDRGEHSGGGGFDDICNNNNSCFVYAPTTTTTSSSGTTCSSSVNQPPLLPPGRLPKIPSLPDLVFDDYALAQIFDDGTADDHQQTAAAFAMHPSLNELLLAGDSAHSSSEADLIYSSANYHPSSSTGGPPVGVVAKRKPVISDDDCIVAAGDATGAGNAPPPAKRLHVSCFDDALPPASGLPAVTSSQVLGGLMSNMLSQF